jgi:hypothetical protein
MSETKNLRAVTQRSRVFELADGTTLELRPLTMRDFGTLEEEAVQAAKSDLIATWARNLEHLPEAMRDAKLLEAFERAEKINAEGMPDREIDVPLRDPATRKVLRDKDTGKALSTKKQIPYAQYWMANTIKGRLTAVWLSARRADPNVTQDQLSEIFQRLGEESLDEAADAVGDLTQSQLGNEEAPATPGPAAANTAL